MTGKNNDGQSDIKQQNISYYNIIAGNYDAILDEDAANKIIREKVATIFTDIVKPGLVLDFGGGTGRDLNWLSASRYQIIFCEPSAQMREKAIHYNQNHLHNNSIIFLDDAHADFANWDNKLPFSQQADGILANFAVMNCIPDIELLFSSLSRVIKPGGHVLALILDNRWKKLFRSYFSSSIKYLFFKKPIAFHVRYNQYQQKVFLHTSAAIKKASSKYFNFYKQETLPEPGFVLIHLTRK